MYEYVDIKVLVDVLTLGFFLFIKCYNAFYDFFFITKIE